MATPVELILASFDGEQTAEKALKDLKDLQKDGVISIANAAVLVKHADGKASFKETEDVRAPAGALFGAIVGGLVGLLGGPAGVIVGAAAGAATGGVAAHEIDMGFSDKNLKEIEALLPNGSSAIIALVTLDWVDKVVQALEALNARLWRQALKDDVLTPTGAPAGAATVIEGKATPVAEAAATPATSAATTAATPAPDPATPAQAAPAPSAPATPPPAPDNPAPDKGQGAA